MIAGRNKKLQGYLIEKYPDIRTIGFTNELNKYLSWADLVLSKPGGVSVFESIYVGTPFIAVYPEYEQEIDNANYVLENKIGAVVWKGESVENRIISIINDNEYLHDCRVACGNLRNSFYQPEDNKDLLKAYGNVV